MPLSLSARSVARSFAPGAVLGRLGSLEARLACDEWEVQAAQALRAQSFFGSGRRPSHDADRFDHACDHLILIDASADGPLAERIVGTTRLIRQDVAGGADGFYSNGEFDLAPLLARNGGQRFLEVGRSCVRPDFRARGGADALWAGIWAYARRHDITVMIGCASLAGPVPAAHAATLSFLAHRHEARGRWAVRAQGQRFSPMDLMPIEAVDGHAARAGLPALVRAYLRLGAMVGEGCVADEVFNTTDVFIVLPVGAIGGRYVAQYGGAASLHAA